MQCWRTTSALYSCCWKTFSCGHHLPHAMVTHKTLHSIRSENCSSRCGSDTRLNRPRNVFSMLHLLDFAVRRCLRDTVPIGEGEAGRHRSPPPRKLSSRTVLGTCFFSLG